MNKHLARRVVLSLAFLALGVAVIGQVAGAWDLSSYSNGWWALFIVVPGLLGIISSGFQFWNVGLVVLGVWLYCDENKFFGDYEYRWLWLLGIFFIYIGIKIILGSFSPHSSHRKFKDYKVTKDNKDYSDFKNANFNESSEDYPEYNCIFSNLNILCKAKNFKGGKANSVFGKMVLDLRDTEIQNNVIFEANSIFGSLDILIPKNIKVKLNMTPVFGAYHNYSVPDDSSENAFTLSLEGSVVFGNINIY